MNQSIDTGSPVAEQVVKRDVTRLVIGLAAALALAVIIALLCLRFGQVFARRWPAIRDALHKELWLFAFASPVFYLATLGILMLERFFPADKRQALLSHSFVQDFVWMFIGTLMSVTVLLTFNAVLRAVYRKHLGFMTIRWPAELPRWLVVLIPILFVDFLAWFHHWVRHKVPWFWLFHTVHHSQKHLNLFTDFRYHVVEYLIGNTIRITGMTLLGLRAPEIIGWVLFHEWYARFYHANIRTNLGPLRYLLVTPQSHRVHHSPHKRHWDKNFGVIFSIWDQLFGTQFRGWNQYPRTGIPNDDFPHETSKNLGALLWTPVAQLIWPFKKIFRVS